MYCGHLRVAARAGSLFRSYGEIQCWLFTLVSLVICLLNYFHFVIFVHKTCCWFCGGLPGRFVAGQFLRRTVRSSKFVLVARGVIAICGDCFELAPRRWGWTVLLACHWFWSPVASLCGCKTFQGYLTSCPSLQRVLCPLYHLRDQRRGLLLWCVEKI